MKTGTINMSDISTSWHENADGLYRRHDQDIPSDHLSSLRTAYEDSNAPAGDMHRVASIPVAVVEKWLREGYDVFQEPVKKTVARLKQEGLDAFVTSKKRL